MFRPKTRAAAEPWSDPCGKTFPRPARRLESFLHERRGQLLPLQRRGCDVGRFHAAAADRDELGEDADGDFFRGDGADVETDRRMHARKALEWHAFLDERVVDLLDLCL